MALANKTVVFTGTLKLKRAEAKKLVQNAGGRVTNTVSAKTSMLVTGCMGESTLSNKVLKAKKFGTEIWTETKFFDSLSGKTDGSKTQKTKKSQKRKYGKAIKSQANPAPQKKKKTSKKGMKTSEKPKKKKSQKKKSSGPRPDPRMPNPENWNLDPVFNIKLNQTNIGANNNKYYIIQLLEDLQGYALWTRWGRFGESGASNLKRFTSIDAAKKAFSKKFYSKTGLKWADRNIYGSKKGKYCIVETEDADGDGGDEEQIWKLSKRQIEKGQHILAQIEKAVCRSGSTQNVIDLSSKFYTVIPTRFGRLRPVPITTEAMVRENQERLKFYLRMGFEELDDADLTPISGVSKLPLPSSLKAAASTICSTSDITTSETQGTKLAQNQAGNPSRNMAAHLYAAIMLYTSNAIYASLNKVLREENRRGVKKYFKYLRLFLEAMKLLPSQKKSLFRGISADLRDQYEVGSTVTWWGVSSCTSDERVARNFMNGCGGQCTLFKLKVNSACDISTISFYSNEKESLLAPGTQFKVKRNTTKGKVTEIDLVEIGRVVC